MAGTSQTVNLGGGQEVTLKTFSEKEARTFVDQFKALAGFYTRYSQNKEGDHVIYDLFMKHIRAIFTAGEIAKEKIEPAAGQFNGLMAQNGFGFRLIRPDDLVVTAQGRTFDVALTGLTKDSWYGYIHNGAIGAAYNATPLYSRKEKLVVILGFLDLSAAPLAEEIQWELNGKELPVFNMLPQMRQMDIPLYEVAIPMVIEPSQQYRSRFKVAAAAGNMNLMPLGVVFERADQMRTVQPTQPSTTAP